MRGVGVNMAHHKIDLAHFRRTNIWAQQQLALTAIADGENGAEQQAFHILAGLVLDDGAIHPLFQQVMNLLMVEIVLTGRLPYSKAGRPKHDDAHIDKTLIAWEFFDMRDDGMTYQETMDELVKRHHKGERHLARIVKDHSTHLPKTKEERDQRREFLRMGARFDAEARKEAAERGEVYETFLERMGRRIEEMRAEAMNRDVLAELDKKMDAALDRIAEMTADKK